MQTLTRQWVLNSGTDTNTVQVEDPRVDILRRIPFFSSLDDEQLAALAERVVVGRYRKNQVLFVEGEPSHSLYFIVKGRAKVHRVSADGREQILHLLSNGDPIAVVPFFDGGAYPADAVILEDSEVAFIRFSEFQEIANANPAILMRMLRVIAGRLRGAQEEIASLSMKNVTARLAARLLDLAEQHGEAADDGIEIDIKLSRQEMGSLIGASRETTTRLLHQFQKERAIRIDGSKITLLKPLILQSWSEL